MYSGLSKNCHLAVFLPYPAPRLARMMPFETTAPHAILVDAKSGIVFFEKNADELVQPASMSKLMTMILVSRP